MDRHFLLILLIFRFRKFSLTFRGSDEDRALMNTDHPQAPTIVIDRTERSVSNERDETRR